MLKAHISFPHLLELQNETQYNLRVESCSQVEVEGTAKKARQYTGPKQPHLRCPSKT
jgi:hypothetical protein